MLAVSEKASFQRDTILPRATRDWLQAIALMALMVLGVVVLLLIGHPAAASDEDDTPQQYAVPFTRSALSNPTEARRLLRRIDRAALRACGDMEGESIAIRTAVRQSQCRRNSVHRAVAQVGDPLLTQAAASYDFWSGRTVQK